MCSCSLVRINCTLAMKALSFTFVGFEVEAVGGGTGVFVPVLEPLSMVEVPE